LAPALTPVWKKEKFLEAFSDRGGLVAEITEGGTIKKGDGHQTQGAAAGGLLLP
jgi:hypothetical protein